MKKIFVFLFLVCAFQLHTQTTPNYQLLTTADGLSQGMIFDIIQSRDGFIWIATKDGLNRYDMTTHMCKYFFPEPLTFETSDAINHECNAHNRVAGSFKPLPSV